MALVRRSLENQGISSEASCVIMQSWRPGTATQYQTYYKKWESFCHRWNINPLQATLQNGINFLGDLFATGEDIAVPIQQEVPCRQSSCAQEIITLVATHLLLDSLKVVLKLGQIPFHDTNKYGTLTPCLS